MVELYEEDSFFTKKEILIWKTWLEVGSVKEVSEKLNLYPSTVSETLKRIRSKVRRAKKTLEIARRLKMIAET